jgi:hypothetical protein
LFAGRGGETSALTTGQYARRIGLDRHKLGTTLAQAHKSDASSNCRTGNLRAVQLLYDAIEIAEEIDV